MIKIISAKTENCLNVETYNINFLDEDGITLIKTVKAASGSTVITPSENEIPNKPNYTFIGWYPKVKIATEDTNYIAKYNPTVIAEQFEEITDNTLVELYEYNAGPTGRASFYYNKYNETYYMLYDTINMKESKLTSQTSSWTTFKGNISYLTGIISTPTRTYIGGKPEIIRAYDSLTMDYVKTITTSSNSEYIKKLWYENNEVFYQKEDKIYKIVNDQSVATNYVLPEFQVRANVGMVKWGKRYVFYFNPVASGNIYPKPMLLISDNGYEFTKFSMGSENLQDALRVGCNDNILFVYKPNGDLYAIANEEGKKVSELTLFKMENNMGADFKPNLSFVNGHLIGLVKNDNKAYIYNGYEWKPCNCKTYKKDGSILNEKVSDAGYSAYVYALEDGNQWTFGSSENMYRITTK